MCCALYSQHCVAGIHLSTCLTLATLGPSIRPQWLPAIERQDTMRTSFELMGHGISIKGVVLQCLKLTGQRAATASCQSFCAVAVTACNRFTPRSWSADVDFSGWPVVLKSSAYTTVHGQLELTVSDTTQTGFTFWDRLPDGSQDSDCPFRLPISISCWSRLL